MTEEIDNIKSLLKEGRMVIGTKRTIKELKQGNLNRIYLTKNAPQTIKDDINYYSKMIGNEIITLDVANDELAVICKKKFSISVMGVLNQRNE